MKKLITLSIGLVLAFSVMAQDYVFFYNPISSPIPNRLVSPYVMKSPNISEFTGRTNALLTDTFPDGVDLTQSKVDSGAVVPLSLADSNLISTLIASNQLQSRIEFTNSVRQAAKDAIEQRFGEQELLIRAAVLALYDIHADTRSRAGFPAVTKAMLKDQVLEYLTNSLADTLE